MASSKISVIIDVAVDQANRGLKSFRQSIAEADTASGKFKAGFGSATDSIKANAGNLALAGGTALVAFGVKAVGAFQATALEAGKLSDSLGLTTEEASRLMEVSGDLGIGLGALETSLGKMNLAAARTPDEFAKIGASIAKNLDGTTNVQQTFLNAVDAINRIPDATDRANAASRIFGKGWREISELIGRGSGELKRNLEDVAGSKVISESDVADARKFRDTLDELGDIGSDALVGIGGALVPVLSLLSQAVVKTNEWKDALVEATDDSDGNSFFGNIKENFGWFITNIREGRSPMEAFGAASDDASDAADRIADSVRNVFDETDTLPGASGRAAAAAVLWADEQERQAAKAADAVQEVADEYKELQDQIADRSAYLDLEDAFANVGAAAAAVADTSDKSFAEQRQDVRDHERAVLDLKQKIFDYALQVEGLKPQVVTDLIAQVDQGKLMSAALQLEALERTRYVNVQLRVSPVGSTFAPGISAPRPGGWDGDPRTPYPAAAGAIVRASPGGSILQVGEGGHDEAIVPLSGPNAPKGLGTTVVNLTVNAGLGTNGAQVGRQIVDVLEAHYRNGGRPPRSG
jgi:hypothetical protein